MLYKQAFLLPSLQGWYGATEVGSRVHVMDGSRPRLLEKKPLLVGEWPPMSVRPDWVLCAILGITYETFLCLFDRVNILKYWKEEKPPRMSTLRVMAGDLKLAGKPVVLLGRRVCQAMGHPLAHYAWEMLGQEWTVSIPHPRNRAYKNKNERLQVQAVLERALLYHGKLFRIGNYPNGTGSMIQIQRGAVWGDAARRLRHRRKRESQAHCDVGIGGYAIRKD